MTDNTEARIRLVLTCPIGVGGAHRWNGDGQCYDCTNYATDLLDAALKVLDATQPDEGEV